jgi:hypothetical protein
MGSLGVAIGQALPALAIDSMVWNVYSNHDQIQNQVDQSAITETFGGDCEKVARKVNPDTKSPDYGSALLRCTLDSMNQVLDQIEGAR